MTGDLWLAASWPFVRDQLPLSPARVLEIGCGRHGGFVPMLRQSGYKADGVDPEAPDAPGYHRIEFERYELSGQIDAVVACTSLHHVADLGDVLDRAAAALASQGTLVVVEWDWERFDEATARWCFARLAPIPAESVPNWLHETRDEWAASHQPWDVYLRSWANQEGLYTGQEMLQKLDARYERQSCSHRPYFFPDLAQTSESDEQAAIDSGHIHATGVRYVGRPNQPTESTLKQLTPLQCASYHRAIRGSSPSQQGWLEIGDRIWVRRYEFADETCAVIGSEHGLVAVDTRASHRHADERLADFAMLSSKPVVAAVNTHGHWDHAFGNARFSHLPTRDRLTTMDLSHEEAEAIGEVEITPPTRLFDDCHTLDLGDRQVELRHLGRGHTDNDIVVRVSDSTATVAGDLIKSPSTSSTIRPSR